MRALVTGGTKGIGRAICEALVRQSYKVVTFSRDFVGRPDGVEWHHCDVSIPQKVTTILSQIGSDFDIVVNNVGGGGTWAIDDASLVYQKNAAVALQITRACLPHMQRKNFGRVVTITSLGNNNVGFMMAKASQTAMMQTLARDYKLVARNITFNCVAPGRIAVGKEADVDQAYLDRLPRLQLCTPEEVAAVVAFLCSKEASGVNGAVIKVGDVP
jgi:3-oxoacyl-[acyl-carrier protein] reductase